jgi:hypothetical protein
MYPPVDIHTAVGEEFVDSHRHCMVVEERRGVGIRTVVVDCGMSATLNDDDQSRSDLRSTVVLRGVSLRLAVVLGRWSTVVLLAAVVLLSWVIRHGGVVCSACGVNASLGVAVSSSERRKQKL